MTGANVYFSIAELAPLVQPGNTNGLVHLGEAAGRHNRKRSIAANTACLFVCLETNFTSIPITFRFGKSQKEARQGELCE